MAQLFARCQKVTCVRWVLLGLRGFWHQPLYGPAVSLLASHWDTTLLPLGGLGGVFDLESLCCIFRGEPTNQVAVPSVVRDGHCCASVTPWSVVISAALQLSVWHKEWKCVWQANRGKIQFSLCLIAGLSYYKACRHRLGKTLHPILGFPYQPWQSPGTA